MFSKTEYRPCVGIMLLNREGEVLVGQRIDMSTEAWQMPQGGIDEGEDPRSAALRELREDIGTDKAEILAERQDWLYYELPSELVEKARHGGWRGQRQKWFVMRFTGTDSDILAGVIEVLGSFRHPEAIPCLIRALYEDYGRQTGEAALLRMGLSASSALLRAASRPAPSAEWESQSSRRARRSTVQLLARIGVPSRQRSRLRVLMEDGDPEVSVHACRACLASADDEEKLEVIRRLIELMPRLGWLMCEEVEECILDHLESARSIIAEHVRGQPPDPNDESANAHIYRSLFRIVQRAGSVTH